MMLNFLSRDSVIRCCTVLCIMNACSDRELALLRTPKEHLVERVFDGCSVLRGFKEADEVQMPSVWMKCFCARTGGNRGCISACTIVTSLGGEKC